jgi:pSer/pThr/pTyr-binding forkhead associated (FHA) protein
MVQLKILSGKKAGADYVARRFPVRIGRAAASDVCLEEPGVWDHHLEIDLQPSEGFVALAQPNALMSVGGQPLSRAVLRNGDVLDVGMARVQFWLSPTVQRRFAFREAVVWAALGLLCALQITLVYLLGGK